MSSINSSVVELYQHWANSVLCEVGIAVDSLNEFQNGALLAILVDLLWPDAQLQNKLQEQGLGEELTEATALQCTQAVLDYLVSLNIKTYVAPKEIVQGDVKSLLDLLWILILHFTVHNPSVVSHQRTVKWGKKKLLEWCSDMLPDLHTDLQQSLTANLCKEGLLATLIQQVCEVEQDEDPTNKLANALTAAEIQLGISQHILDPLAVIQGSVEEHSLIVYIALLRRKALLLEDLAPHERGYPVPPPGGAMGGLDGQGLPPGMQGIHLDPNGMPQGIPEGILPEGILPEGMIPEGMSPGMMQGGVPGQQWSAYNLPPEALEAMGLDGGDYVMYAIVEEHYIPPESMEQFQNQFDQLQIFDEEPHKSTVQIKEIFSDDEGSNQGSKRGTPEPNQRTSPPGLHPVDEMEENEELTKTHDSGADGDVFQFFAEKGRLAQEGLSRSASIDMPRLDVNDSPDAESGRTSHFGFAPRNAFVTTNQMHNEDSHQSGDNTLYLAFLENSSDADTPEMLTARTPRDSQNVIMAGDESDENVTFMTLPKHATSSTKDRLKTTTQDKQNENKSKPPKLKELPKHSYSGSPRSPTLQVKAPEGITVTQQDERVELIMKTDITSAHNPKKSKQGKSLADLDNLRQSFSGKSGKYVSKMNLDISPQPGSPKSVSSQDSRTEDVSSAISKSQSLRADIAKMLGGALRHGSSTESPTRGDTSVDSEEAFNSTGHCDDEVAATVAAMNNLLAKQAVEDGSEEVPELERSGATFTPIDLPRQMSEEDWMDASFSSLMTTANEDSLLTQSFAKSGSKQSMEKIAESEEAEVSDAIKAAVKEQMSFIRRSSPEEIPASLETTDSCQVQQGGSDRSSLDISFEETAPMTADDELLVLLEHIASQGANMKSELELAHAREAMIEHSKILEDDTMTELLAKLKAEIDILREENSLLQQEVQATGRISEEEKDKIDTLENKITELTSKVTILKREKNKEQEKQKKRVKMKTTGVSTDQLIKINQPSQTIQTYSKFQMRDKGLQVQSESVGKGVQVTPVIFTRNRITSTADLKPSCVNIGVQVYGLKYSKDIGIQVKDLTVNKHKYIQTNLIEVMKEMTTQTDNAQLSEYYDPAESVKPTASAIRMLERMLSQISALAKDRSVADSMVHLQSLEGSPEGRDKWQQLSMTPLSTDPVVLQLQKSLATAALENEVLSSRITRGPSEAPARVMVQADTHSYRDPERQPSEMDMLKDRILSLERTLSTAQEDNYRLTGKLEETLEIVKEKIDTSPMKMSKMEIENEVLKTKLARVEQEKGHLEESLTELQENHQHSVETMSSLESSLAGVESERRLLHTEVTVLREEYQYIKKGMNIMEKFFSFDRASKTKDHEDGLDVNESSGEEPQESADEEVIEITRRQDMSRAPNTVARRQVMPRQSNSGARRQEATKKLPASKKEETAKRELHKRENTPKKQEVSRTDSTKKRIEKKPDVKLSNMDKARLVRTQEKEEREELRGRKKDIDLSVRGRRAMSAPSTGKPQGSTLPEKRIISRSEERPSTKTKDISSKVQKELAKRFPSRTLSTREDQRKDWMPKKRTQPEIKPLLDANKVKDMGVDELRKKRLAMLVQSYTGRHDPEMLKKKFEQSSTEDGSSAEESTSVPLQSRAKQLSHPRKVLTPVPDIGERPETPPSGQRRKLPFIPRQQRSESISSDQGDDQENIEYLQLPARDGSTSSVRDSAYTSERVSEADNSDTYLSHSHKPTSILSKSSQGVTPLISTTDSGVSDIGSLGRQSMEELKIDLSSDKPHKVPSLSKGPFLYRSGSVENISTATSPRASQQARDTLDRTISWRKNTSQESPAATSQPSSGNMRRSSKDIDTDSGSTSSSVRDLISSLNDRTQPKPGPNDSSIKVQKYSNDTDGAYLTLSDLQTSETHLDDIRENALSSHRKTSSSTQELVTAKHGSGSAVSEVLSRRQSTASGSEGNRRHSSGSISDLDLLVTHSGDIINRSERTSSVDRPGNGPRERVSSLDRFKYDSLDRKSNLDRSSLSPRSLERRKEGPEKITASSAGSSRIAPKPYWTTVTDINTYITKDSSGVEKYWSEPKPLDSTYKSEHAKSRESKKYSSSVSDLDLSPRTSKADLISRNKYSSHNDVAKLREKYTNHSQDHGVSRPRKYNSAGSLRTKTDSVTHSRSSLQDSGPQRSPRTLTNAWSSTQSLHVSGQNLGASIRETLLDDPGNMRPTEARSTASLTRSDQSLESTNSPRGGSSLTKLQKKYADDLVDRYTNAWRTPTRSSLHDPPSTKPSRQLFADESKYLVDELVEKYTTPGWSLS